MTDRTETPMDELDEDLTCPACGGDGMEDDSMPCEYCDGEGYKWWM